MALSTAPVTRPFLCSSLGISLSATSTASTGVLIPGVGTILRVVNEGPSIAFVSLGNQVASAAATLPTTGNGVTTCVPILPGSDVSFTRDVQAEKYISAICRSGGTATLTIQTGEGN